MSSSATLLVTILDAPIAITQQTALHLQASVQHDPATSQESLVQYTTYAWTMHAVAPIDPTFLLAHPNGGALDCTNASYLLPSSSSSSLSSGVNLAQLVLRPNLLPPGQYYFQVEATDTTPGATHPVDGRVRSSTAAVTISVLAPPVPGVCTMQPMSGIEFLTDFQVECAEWYLTDDDQPQILYSAARADATAVTASGATGEVSSGVVYTPVYLPTFSPSFSFLLPSGSWTLEVLISSASGAVSTVSFPVVVSAVPIAIGSTSYLDFLQTLLDTLVTPALSEGDIETALLLLLEISEKLNEAIAANPVLSGSAQAITLSSELLAGVSSVLAQHPPLSLSDGEVSPDSTTELSNIAYAQLSSSVVSSILVQSSSFDASMWQLAYNETLLVIQHRQETLGYTVPGGGAAENTLPVEEQQMLSDALDHLMTNCSHLDDIARGIQLLLTASQTNQLPGSVVALTSSGFNATSTRAPVFSGPIFPGRNLSASAAAAWSAYGATLDGNTVVDFDTISSSAWSVMDTRVVAWSSLWSACRGVSELHDVSVNTPDGSAIDLHLAEPITFGLDLSGNDTRHLWEDAQAASCPGQSLTLEEAIAQGVTCQYWNMTTQAMDSTGCLLREVHTMSADTTISTRANVTNLIDCQCPTAYGLSFVMHSPPEQECTERVGSTVAFGMYAGLYALLGAISLAFATKDYCWKSKRTKVAAGEGTEGDGFEAEGSPATAAAIHPVASTASSMSAFYFGASQEHLFLSLLCILRTVEVLCVDSMMSGLGLHDQVTILLTSLPYFALVWIYLLQAKWYQRTLLWIRQTWMRATAQANVAAEGTRGGIAEAASTAGKYVIAQVANTTSSRSKNAGSWNKQPNDGRSAGSDAAEEAATDRSKSPIRSTAAASSLPVAGFVVHGDPLVNASLSSCFHLVPRQRLTGFASCILLLCILVGTCLMVAPSTASPSFSSTLVRAHWFLIGVIHSAFATITIVNARMQRPPNHQVHGVQVTGSSGLRGSGSSSMTEAVSTLIACAAAEEQRGSSVLLSRLRLLSVLAGTTALLAAVLALGFALSSTLLSLYGFPLLSSYFLLDWGALTAICLYWRGQLLADTHRREHARKISQAISDEIARRKELSVSSSSRSSKQVRR